MRRLLRFALYACLLLVVVVTGLVAWLHFSPIPSYPTRSISFPVGRAPEQVAEGKRLATMMCFGCHRDSKTGTLSGAVIGDVPAKFGRFYSANITRDRENGIGAYTDGQLAYLLRTGIRRDGRLAVVMPAFPGLADVDVQAIIAFITSDDPIVRATPVRSRAPEPSLFGKFLVHFVFAPHGYPADPVALPPASDKVALGRYLALRRHHCYECHSADFAKQDAEQPEKSAGFFGGGNPLLDVNGEEIYSPNITFDRETGIGRLSEAAFVRLMLTGMRPDNTIVQPPMSPFPLMTSEEAAAIFAYLQTVPVLKNARRVSPAMQRARAAAHTGQETFTRYCIPCHGQDGRAPYDLTRAADRYPRDEQLKAWIRRPADFRPGTAMPAWDGILREDEYDGLIAHVRGLARAANR